MIGIGTGVHLALRCAALATLAAALVALAALPAWRWQADATKTRAYTLSPQTLRLLASLEGSWSVTVVVAEDGVDGAVLRQIDEVLRRFRDAGPIDVDRIDPTDPRSIDRWLALLESLQEQWSDRVGPFRERLDEATERFVALRDFAGVQQPTLERLAEASAALPPELRVEASTAIESARGALAQLVVQGETFLDGLRELRQTSPARPIPDDEAARSALHASHRHWSEQLHALSRLLDRYATAAPDSGTRQAARQFAEASERLAVELRQSQDRLSRLPALELSDIARAIADGETAIVSGPLGTTAIPSWQLLPRLASGESGEGVRFDRRFRGEQVIAAAIRSLQASPPVVTIVHAEDRSLLRSTGDGADLHAVADALRAARIEVREWSIVEPAPPAAMSTRGESRGQSRGESGGESRRDVWLIVPPMARRGVDTAPAERLLIERTRALLDRGEPTLITMARSLLPAFRQRDPWSALVAEIGVEADTGTVIFELDRTGTGRGAVRAWQVVDRGASDHPLAMVVDGLATLLTHPTPLRVIADQSEIAGRRTWPLLAIDPGAMRWLEADWRTEGQQRSAPPIGSALDAPVPVALATEAADPVDLALRPRRAVVVGSGGWLHSSVFGGSEALGGGRLALTSPGNRELLLGGVHWLAGMDELVVPGPSGREVARLGALDPTERTLWSALAIVALPATALTLGGLVALRRRRP